MSYEITTQGGRLTNIRMYFSNIATSGGTTLRITMVSDYEFEYCN